MTLRLALLVASLHTVSIVRAQALPDVERAPSHHQLDAQLADSRRQAVGARVLSSTGIALLFGVLPWLGTTLVLAYEVWPGSFSEPGWQIALGTTACHLVVGVVLAISGDLWRASPVERMRPRSGGAASLRAVSVSF